VEHTRNRAALDEPHDDARLEAGCPARIAQRPIEVGVVLGSGAVVEREPLLPPQPRHIGGGDLGLMRAFHHAS
jgi:hypothetical protein